MNYIRPLKVSVSITIDRDILEKARDRAIMCDRSLSQYINIILKKHLNDKKSNNEVDK